MEQEKRTPGQRALDPVRLLLPNWQPATQDVLRWIRIIIAVGIVILGGLLILDVVSSIFGIKLWNLLKVLAVPITVGAAVPWLNWLQKKREQGVEDQRAQDEALQAYLTQMSQLLTDKDQPLDEAQLGDRLSTIARARTLTVLARLDGGRKGAVLKFLRETDLITKDNLVLSLQKGDLNKVSIRGVNLSRANLSEASLKESDLRYANLEQADLRGAYLMEADLTNARGVMLTQLAVANLGRMRAVDLETGQIKQLGSATMPDGRKYEDWLKEPEGHEEARETSGPS